MCRLFVVTGLQWFTNSFKHHNKRWRARSARDCAVTFFFLPVRCGDDTRPLPSLVSVPIVFIVFIAQIRGFSLSALFHINKNFIVDSVVTNSCYVFPDSVLWLLYPISLKNVVQSYKPHFFARVFLDQFGDGGIGCGRRWTRHGGVPVSISLGALGMPAQCVHQKVRQQLLFACK